MISLQAFPDWRARSEENSALHRNQSDCRIWRILPAHTLRKKYISLTCVQASFQALLFLLWFLFRWLSSHCWKDLEWRQNWTQKSSPPVPQYAGTDTRQGTLSSGIQTTLTETRVYWYSYKPTWVFCRHRCCFMQEGLTLSFPVVAKVKIQENA